jgi:hypothetical protein
VCLCVSRQSTWLSTRHATQIPSQATIQRPESGFISFVILRSRLRSVILRGPDRRCPTDECPNIRLCDVIEMLATDELLVCADSDLDGAS